MNIEHFIVDHAGAQSLEQVSDWILDYVNPLEPEYALAKEYRRSMIALEQALERLEYEFG